MAMKRQFTQMIQKLDDSMDSPLGLIHIFPRPLTICVHLRSSAVHFFFESSDGHRPPLQSENESSAFIRGFLLIAAIAGIEKAWFPDVGESSCASALTHTHSKSPFHEIPQCAHPDGRALAAP